MIRALSSNTGYFGQHRAPACCLVHVFGISVCRRGHGLEKALQYQNDKVKTLQYESLYSDSVPEFLRYSKCICLQKLQFECRFLKDQCPTLNPYFLLSDFKFSLLVTVSGLLVPFDPLCRTLISESFLMLKKWEEFLIT